MVNAQTPGCSTPGDNRLKLPTWPLGIPNRTPRLSLLKPVLRFTPETGKEAKDRLFLGLV